ncbi:MAG TPA: LysR family transcriptional regulator [Steroidobacteraceae bacterium]|nr:LysR family transcriptional regulator [Steroidobacteraceae bacterium]
MDRLDELAVLVAVVDHGSLAAAARRLRRSPPAITRALAALERRIGARLVERTTRRLSPTEAGRALAESSRALLGAYDAAVTGVSPAPVRGLLRVTAPLQFGRRHVAPLVASFLDEFPESQVELVLHDRNLDLIEEGLDVAVRIGALADSSLLVRRVGQVHRVLVASPDYLSKRGTPGKPADLALHDTIFGTATQRPLEWRFDGRGPAAIVRLAPRLLVNEAEAQLVAARAGRGIARVLSYQVADDISAGTLVRLLQAFEPPPLPVQLVAVSRAYMAPKVRAFLDHAATRLERLRLIHERPRANALSPEGLEKVAKRAR